MARKKSYNEAEVIEKSLDIFWRNGFESTSTRMLEKQMGINQFSIYSSFGSKQGVYLESMKLYLSNLNNILVKAETVYSGIEAIKQYFYDFIEFIHENGIGRSCFVVNTVAEFGQDTDAEIMNEVLKFIKKRDDIFIQRLKEYKKYDEVELIKQVNFFAITLSGLAISSKIIEKKHLYTFVESAFEKI